MHITAIDASHSKAKQEDGGYRESFLHVEEILGGSFGVCEVSDFIQALYSNCVLMWCKKDQGECVVHGSMIKNRTKTLSSL